jgi:small-conductance mechanosensitive channel
MQSLGIDIGTYRLSMFSVVSSLLVGVLLFFIVKLALRSLRMLLRRNPRIDETQRLLIEKLVGILLFGVALLVGLDVLGIDLTALTIFSGALGLAVGFGMQKTVGNLIAGIILLMDHSIKPGDLIVVGEGLAGKGSAEGTSAVGRVTRIGVRAVTVVTRDGRKHIIPNELLMTQPVENWSYSSPEVRIRMKVGVSYDSDIRLAQRLMIEATKRNSRVLATPEPVVWITSFGPSAVEHEIRFWIADPEMGLGNIQGELYLDIWDSFHEHGVRLPFQQLDIRMFRDKKAVAPGEAAAPSPQAGDETAATPKPKSGS